jgi:hypothetical protein
LRVARARRRTRPSTAFADPGLPPYIVPIETWLAAVIPEYRQNAAL